ncbi:MAG: T9SS type A sorting domain-containing protein [Chitinophagales bacterium]
MDKLTWLTTIAILCCCTCFAQASKDTAQDQESFWSENTQPFSQFTCKVKNSNSVWLQWKTENTSDGDYFIVERSQEGIQYETVGVLKVGEAMNDYGLSDNSPPNGINFYRIRWMGKSGKSVYSRIVQASLSSDVDFRFYPNPVDKLLIIRTEHSIDVEAVDDMGNIRLNKRLQPGLQIINVSTLEKGNYVLRIADRDSNRVISAQLLKN